MRTRTYTGRDMPTVLAQIRAELGDEVVIVSTKHLAGPSGQVIEVCAVPGVGQGIAGDVTVRTERRRKRAPLKKGEAQRLERLLVDQAVQPELAVELLKAVRSVPRQTVPELALSEALGRTLTFDTSLTGKPKYVALVGPTGSGKTTTIAKLAANMQAAFGLKIGLLSADNFRIGAGAQLQAYAGLMELPYRMVTAGKSVATELARIAESFSSLDIVFVDTVGVSPSEPKRIQRLTSDLGALPELETLLVLPAPSSRAHLDCVIDSYRPLNYRRAIITKLDETGLIGPAVSAAWAESLPLAFLTTGQRVPEDIEPASARRLGWMLSRPIH